MKWGEYSNDVQFILQRSEAQKVEQTLTKTVPFEQQKTQLDQKSSHLIGDAIGSQNVHATINEQSNNLNNFNINNSIERKSDLVGIVKGIQKQNTNLIPKSPSSPTPLPSLTTTDGNESIASVSSTTASSLSGSPQKPTVIEFNSADVRNSLDRKTNALRNSNDSSQNDSTDESLNTSSSASDIMKNCSISSNGALVPPPYRNPPPPRCSPNSMAYVHQKSDSLSSNNSGGGSSGYRQTRSNKFDFLKEMTPPLSAPKTKMDFINNDDGLNDIINDNVLQNAQFRDLLQLIKFQRDKINSQQADITKVYKS